MEEKKQIEAEEAAAASKSCLTPRRKVLLKHFAIAALWVIVFEAIGAGLGAGFAAGTWYRDLNKSPLSPPNAAFGIVWAFLFALLAIFGWLLSNKLEERQIKVAFGMYWVQMIVTWFWQPTFFLWHDTIASLSMLCFLLVLNALMIIRVATLDLTILRVRTRYMPLIILPYYAWISFATYLNVYIVQNN